VILTESDEQMRKEQLLSLEQKLAAIRAGRGALPSATSIKRAKQEMQNKAEPRGAGDVE
jgi:hypothetical protein